MSGRVGRRRSAGAEESVLPAGERVEVSFETNAVLMGSATRVAIPTEAEPAVINVHQFPLLRTPSRCLKKALSTATHRMEVHFPQ